MRRGLSLFILLIFALSLYATNSTTVYNESIVNSAFKEATYAKLDSSIPSSIASFDRTLTYVYNYTVKRRKCAERDDEGNCVEYKKVTETHHKTYEIDAGPIYVASIIYQREIPEIDFDYPTYYSYAHIRSMEEGPFVVSDHLSRLKGYRNNVNDVFNQELSSVRESIIIDNVVAGGVLGASILGGVGTIFGGVGAVPGAAVGAVLGGISGLVVGYTNNVTSVKLETIHGEDIKELYENHFNGNRLASANEQYLDEFVSMYNDMIDYYNEDVGLLNSIDSKLRDAGAFDESYNGNYSDDVDELYSLKISLLNYTDHFKDATFDIHKYASDSSIEDIQKLAPMLHLGYSMVNGYWNGDGSFVVLLSRYSQLGNDTFNGILEEYKSSRDNYLNYQSRLNSEVGNISLYSGVTFEDFSSFELGGQELDANTFQVLNEPIGSFVVDQSCNYKDYYNYKDVVPCIIKYNNAVNNISKKLFDIVEAKEAVDTLYPIAKRETDEMYTLMENRCKTLNSTYPLVAESVCIPNLEAAREHMNPPDSMTYHERLVELNTAMAYLKGLDTFTSNNQSVTLMNVSMYYIGKTNDLYELVSLMEKDGVNVGNIKQALLNINNTLKLTTNEVALSDAVRSYNELYNNVNQLKLSYYSSLNSRALYVSRIYNKLALSDSNYNRLKPYLSMNGGINVDKVVGHYSEVNGLLDSLERTIEIKAKDFITRDFQNSLWVSYSSESRIGLDELVKEIAVVEFTSDLDISYNDPLTVKLTLPGDYGSYVVADVPDGMQVALSGNTLTVSMRKFRPGSYTVKLERESRPISTLSKTLTCGEATMDSMECSEVISFNVDGTYKGVDFPTSLDGDYVVYVDGARMDTGIGDYTYDHYLNPGSHEIKFEYTIAAPLDVSTDFQTVGGKKELTAEVKPAVDGAEIPSATLTFDLPSDLESVTNLQVSGDSCSVSNYSLTSGAIHVNLNGLKPDGCKVKISAVMTVDPEVVEDLINDKLNDPEYSNISEVNTLLNNALNAVNSGNVDEGYELYNQAIQEYNNHLRNQQVNQAVNTRVEHFTETIEDIREHIDSIDVPEIKDMVENVSSLLDSAKEEQDSERKKALVEQAKQVITRITNKTSTLKLNLTDELSAIKDMWANAVSLGVYDPEVASEINDLQREINLIDPSNLKGLDRIKKIKERLNALKDKVEKASNSTPDYMKEISSKKSQLKALLDSMTASCGGDCPSDLITRAKNLLSMKPNDQYEARKLSEYIDGLKTSIGDYIKAEKTSADNSISRLNVLLGRLSDDERAKYSDEINAIKELYSSGKYYEASKRAEELIAKIGPRSSKAADYTMVIAGIALLLMAGLAVKYKDKLSGSGEKLNNEESEEMELKSLKKEED